LFSSAVARNLSAVPSIHFAGLNWRPMKANAVRQFGKTDAEIDRIIGQRMADPTLVVPSPIIGRITARNAAVDFADSHAKLMLRAFGGMS
jgi:hypothetical protein